jgi:hypothetical protein
LATQEELDRWEILGQDPKPGETYPTLEEVADVAVLPELLVEAGVKDPAVVNSAPNRQVRVFRLKFGDDVR